MKTRRIAILLATVLAAAGIAACEEEEVTRGETEGVYVTVDGLQYQVQISRQLNPENSEDRDYLLGVEGAEARLAGNEEWFAVFLRVRNAEKEGPARLTASKFLIEDTAGAEFEPVELAREHSPHAYTPQRIAPKTYYPSMDIAAGASTSQGALVLFKLTRRALDNRPLEFHIESPSGGADALVDLDV